MHWKSFPGVYPANTNLSFPQWSERQESTLPFTNQSPKTNTTCTQIVPRPDFEAALKALAEKEKAAQLTLDNLASERRELPMVKIDKPYQFHGPEGSVLSLDDLFAGKDQLIVYHFMFAPESERGCSGCAFVGLWFS